MQSRSSEEDDDFSSAQESDDENFKTRAALPESGRLLYCRKAKKKNMGDDKSNDKQSSASGSDGAAELLKELERVKKQLAAEQNQLLETAEIAKRYRREREEQKSQLEKVAKEKAEMEQNYIKLQSVAENLRKQASAENQDEVDLTENKMEEEAEKIFNEQLRALEEEEKLIQQRKTTLLDGFHFMNKYKRNGAAPKGTQPFNLASVNDALPENPSQRSNQINNEVSPENGAQSYHQPQNEMDPQIEVHQNAQQPQQSLQMHVAPATNSFGLNFALNNMHKTTGVLNADSKEFPNWLRKLTSCFVINGLWFNLNSKFASLSEADQNKSLLARHVLELCVDGTSQREISRYHNSIDALNALIRLHDASSSTNRIATQQRISNMFYREGDDMVKHISELREAYDDLARYGSPATDRQQTDQLICSLPTSMNSVRNVYTAWPSHQYTFDNVAINLRESYKRDQLVKQKNNSKLPTDKGYSVDKVDARRDSSNDRSRFTKFQSNDQYRDRNRERTSSREHFRERSSSRNRYDKRRSSGSQNDAEPKSRGGSHSFSRNQSPSSQRGRSPASYNRSPYRSRDRSRERSRSEQRSNKISATNEESSASYHDHGGYSTTVSHHTASTADDWKPVTLDPLNKLRQRLQTKKKHLRPYAIARRREKRYTKRCGVRKALELANKKNLSSTMLRPVKSSMQMPPSASTSVQTTESLNKMSAPLPGEEYPNNPPG